MRLLNRLLVSLACWAYTRRSRFYWLFHEAHLLCYWWERPPEARWVLDNRVYEVFGKDKRMVAFVVAGDSSEARELAGVDPGCDAFQVYPSVPRVVYKVRSK